VTRSLLTVAALALFAVAILWIKQHTPVMDDCRAVSDHCIPDAHHPQIKP
jgi:hypothetical protein